MHKKEIRNMGFFKRIASVLLAAALLAAPGFAYADGAPDISSRGAVVIEQTSGKVLWGKNAHERLPMASTTKIMTALVAIENSSLDEIVTVPSEAYGTEGSSMYLALGEKVSMKDLLYGLMLSSGNDAAVAIAVHVGKSVEGFVNMMNERARGLGLVNTHFVTPNGLHDDEHYTTAYELALVAREAMNNETFREIVSTVYYSTETGNSVRYLKNKNKLLWQYEGATGIKTGYTKAAGKCLVFSADKGGMETVGVVLNSGNIFVDSANMLNHAHENYQMQTFASRGDVLARVRVSGSGKKLLALTVNEDIILPVCSYQDSRYETRVLLDTGVSAPIYTGDVLGYVELYDGTMLICRAELTAAEDAPKYELADYLDILFNIW